jgi:hypothetical protein
MQHCEFTVGRLNFISRANRYPIHIYSIYIQPRIIQKYEPGEDSNLSLLEEAKPAAFDHYTTGSVFNDRPLILAYEFDIWPMFG